MGIGTSIFLAAVGAILAFAINVNNSHGVNINTIGIILMVVGGFGILLSLFFWNSWGGGMGRRSVRRETIVRDPGVRDPLMRDPLDRDRTERDPYGRY